VLFYGDSIIDEYHYVKPLGKSPKEHIIPVRYEDKEVFNGGVEAAANHTRNFCWNVDVCTGGHLTRKVRFIDPNYTRKLFEVHYHETVNPPITALGEYDAVVVTDFGHGFISKAMIADLESEQFLAVNAQTNSANIGFNLITKYRKADYIVIDEPEARLAAQDRDSHIEDILHKLAHGRCERFVITHGLHGSYGYDNGKFYHQEAFTDRVLDTMGAGDAFFAVTAPMAKTGSMEDLLLIGNAAGALKCQIVGHRKSIEKEALIGFIRESQKG
jgi:bifunctional ADP-heptose synthase (sugar kinase/adenylyltransferase)